MKKIFLVCATLLLGVIQPNIGFADFFTDASGSVSTIIPVTGRIDNATQSWSGSLITNFDIDGAPVRTSVMTQEMYFDNLAGSFSGFFVLTAACATTSCKDASGNWDSSAFVSFNHGVGGNQATLTLDSGDVYKMNGFAWSKSSGWIAFNVGSDPVKYNRATGLFSGSAWSKNLGYISMNGLKMWTKAPDLNITGNIMLVNHDQMLGTGTLGNLDGLEPYTLTFSVTVPKDSTGQSKVTWTGAVANFDHVDLRLPGTYHYDYTDPFGNNTTGDLQVLTDKPTNTLYDGTPSPLLTIAQTSTPANGSSIGQIKIDLHDKYGNAIKDVANFKSVQFTVKIKNTISPNQTQFDEIDGLTIDKSCPQYGLSIVPSGSLFTGSLSAQYLGVICSGKSHTSSGYVNTYLNSSGGILDIASYMPTDSDNKLELVEALYTITSDYTQDLSKNVGQDVGDLTSMLNPVTDKKYMSFSKLGSADFYLQNGTIGRFGLGLPFDTKSNWSTVPNTFSDNKFYHLYTTQTGSVNLGLALSFSGISTGATVVDLYSSLSTQPVWRFIQKTPNLPADNFFSLIPEVLGSSLSQIDFDLQHQVVHTFNNGSNNFSYVFGEAAGTGVTQNRGIKIIGTASTSNSGSIFALNTQDEYTKVGNFSKPQVKDFVRQNVEAIIRNPSTDALVKDVPFDLNSTDSSWQSKQTIIVRNKDLTISTDVPPLSNGKPRAIIVIGGDIKIGPGVQNIQASIFTDRGLYAIDSGNLITDSNRSSNQLYIFGTLISGNTVGTSAQSANGGACPDFLPKTCSPDQKKQYDLNFLRTGPSPGSVVVSEYPEYPVVIRYNPKLTSDPPPGFKKIAR